ncbi:Lrp/AsnC family transcriptional regulator [Kribbella jejuensis]|uniref:DNA-binding Lrp family transcriptional regulator n=1 Tax=Kribbella jejuensis TaxID=236068 RepID=A0A542EV32_9ACTN|nr:Lrp/AsnC family transcriptional regulator [Kribbella jejuensis]TQJ19044.1 DNA-binding Lrp family transcriptional regulator [Kribbella jejuensis]
MDAIDRQILAVLQTEGRLTVTELAQRVGLSAAPCHRRLRELEKAGVIRGYRALVDGAAVGHGFEVLLAVTIDRETSVAGFESGLAEIPEVVHAERLFGEPDYFVRVATADLGAFQKLRDERLARLPGVLRLTSTIVMKKIVDNRPLPT